MEQNKNSESPDSPPPPEPALAKAGSVLDKDGREIPPTHPDHGPMHLLPRQEDGSFAAYYYCSGDELHDAEIVGPPPRRQRRDGFTPARQEEFIEEIRGGASGREAARLVGISPTTAYNLYNSRDGGAFRQAWDEAARATDMVLEDTAFDRAVNGQEEPVFHNGEPVGTRRKYDNKLLMQLLRARLPLKYAPLSEIEGWLRHRGVAPAPDVDGALDRLRAAEAEWGRHLPGEEAPPRIDNETVRPELGDARPERADEPRFPAEEETGMASSESASSPSTSEQPPVASTSSTSSGNGQAEDRDSASTSFTSSGSGQDPPAPARPATEPGPPPEDPSLIPYRRPPLPRITQL